MNGFASVGFHRMLVNDRPRSLAYQAAIREVVKPGDVVLDMGAGSGILSFFACQAGAARVYAVERTPIIGLARRLSRDNGFEQRIRFLQDDLEDVVLDERVDVVVSELISKTFLGQRMEELTALARERFLKPGGMLLPESVDFFLVPVDATTAHRQLRLPERQEYGLDFGFMEALEMNSVQSTRLEGHVLLAPGELAYRIVSAEVRADQRPRARLCFRVNRAGQFNGLASWFNTRLSPGQVLATREHLTSWDNAYFPLPEPVDVVPGMEIELDFRVAHPKGGDLLFEWDVRIWASSERGDSARLGRQRQSSLAGMVPLLSGSGG